MLRKHLPLTMIAVLLLGLAAPVAHARKRPRAQPKPAAQPAATVERTEKSAPSSAETAPPPAANSANNPPAPAPAAGGGSAKPRVYTFSGLDVNGNLKAPQLLFFRGRVKQELDTSNPEKRSFLKELERTADAKGL